MTKRNDDIFRLRELAIDRDDARDSLKGGISETKDQLRPSNLVRRAKKVALNQAQGGGKKISGTVKENPLVTTSILAAITVAAFHRPIAKLIGIGLDRLSDKSQQQNHETGE